MIQVTITQINGVDLLNNKVIAIDPEKIVWTRETDGVCLFLYAETYDRRDSPNLYKTNIAQAAIDANITGSLLEFDDSGMGVYDPVSREIFDIHIQEKFIKSMRDVEAWIDPSEIVATYPKLDDVVELIYEEGAFHEVVLYAFGEVADWATVITTTTTTVAATTTTTTEAATTTTTTEAATTTTTTEAATTTTTTEAVTTTTTTAAVTTTTTTSGT